MKTTFLALRAVMIVCVVNAVQYGVNYFLSGEIRRPNLKNSLNELVRPVDQIHGMAMGHSFSQLQRNPFGYRMAPATLTEQLRDLADPPLKFQGSPKNGFSWAVNDFKR